MHKPKMPKTPLSSSASRPFNRYETGISKAVLNNAEKKRMEKINIASEGCVIGAMKSRMYGC